MGGGGKAAAALQPPAERRRGRGRAEAAVPRPRTLGRGRRRRGGGVRLVAGWNGRAASGRRSRESGGGGLSLPLPPRRRGSPFRLPRCGGEPAPAGGAAGGSAEGERSPSHARDEALRLSGGSGRVCGGAFAGARNCSPAWAGPPLTVGGILLFDVG